MFQRIEAKNLTENVFSLISDKWMLITAGTAEHCNTMTASWGGLGVIWGAPSATCYIRPQRYTKEFIDNGETFSMTFFDKKYKNDLKYFGAVSGRQEDKFKTSGLNLNYHNDVPFVDEGNLAFICKKMAAVPITKDMFIDMDIDEKWYSKANLDDYHTMYIGEITDILAR